MSTQRKQLTGFVKSNKMMKTVVVEVGRTYRHPVYKKVVHTYKRFKAHDELGCEVGDKVTLIESRPLSRDKRWVVRSIDKRLNQTDVLLQEHPAEEPEGGQS